jgi:uncharacterized protein (UPF0276 family)
VLKERLFKNYGVGTGLRAPYFEAFLDPVARPKSVQWLEVISENFMGGKKLPNTRSILTLEKIRRDFPIALHGVSLSIGSMHGLDLDYLKTLKALVDRIDPIVISDHLCWTRIHGVQTHDLNPLPYTRELVEHVAGKIRQVQDFMGRRMLIENVSSYLTFEQSTMSEEEFIAQVIERADCGVLLDINNVYVSSVNHQFNAHEFLSRVPHHRVGQIHLAGHTNRDGFLIDTHDEPVSDAVWDLYRWYGEQFGHASSMIERDGNIPEWKVLEQEVVKMKSLFQPEARGQTSVEQPVLKTAGFYGEADQKKWAASLAAGFEVPGIREQAPLSARERFGIYEDAFWIRLNEAVSDDFKRIRSQVMKDADEEVWDQLVFDALSESLPSSWSIIELGESFLSGLKKLDYDQTSPENFALAEQDWARVRAHQMTHAVSEANPDFTALQNLTEEQLNKVILVLHPSAQVISSQKYAVWAAKTLEEKHFSSDEWKGMVSLLEPLPMVELTEHPEAIQEWVRTGLIYGWKMKI